MMLLAALLVLPCLVSLTLAISPKQYKPRTHSHVEKDQRGAVASESAVCSRIGVNLIKAGGNAADAVSFMISYLARTKSQMHEC